MNLNIKLQYKHFNKADHKAKLKIHCT